MSNNYFSVQSCVNLYSICACSVRACVYSMSLTFLFSSPEDKLLDDKDTLEKHGIKDGDRLYFKDLGHQVGYRTVSGQMYDLANEAWLQRVAVFVMIALGRIGLHSTIYTYHL